MEQTLTLPYCSRFSIYCSCKSPIFATFVGDPILSLASASRKHIQREKEKHKKLYNSSIFNNKRKTYVFQNQTKKLYQGKN